MKVIGKGDDREGQFGIVYALFDDDGGGLTVKFKGEKEPYTFRRTN